ncbi:hypothetical protein K7X08_032501 [Anisodus acutangulus]|uniref:Uncharacterized protein n=1 Tax=Anisodus acutangulus TaxID=402998 RepID=A0A9Q1LRC1_9SOLA|nr:hypothetical protein K7X08_032501 [Anisodus acutangulus]
MSHPEHNSQPKPTLVSLVSPLDIATTSDQNLTSSPSKSVPFTDPHTLTSLLLPSILATSHRCKSPTPQKFVPDSEPSTPKEVTTPDVNDDSMSTFDISSDKEEIEEKEKEYEVSSQKLVVERENTVGYEVSEAPTVPQVLTENTLREQVPKIEKERAEGITTEPEIQLKSHPQEGPGSSEEMKKGNAQLKAEVADLRTQVRNLTDALLAKL